MIILIVVCAVVVLSFLLSIASFSNEKFLDTYNDCKLKNTSANLTIQDFIHLLNFKYFKNKLKFSQTKIDVDNFYNSKHKVIALSRDTLSSNSIASFAIVSHEMGHALQDQNGCKLKFLTFLRRVGMLLGVLFMPSLITGIIMFLFFSDFKDIGIYLFIISASIFLLSIILKTATISIEKDASKKGLIFLKEFLQPKEIAECKKLLKAAKMTYWADLLKLLFSWTLLTNKTKMFN